MFSSDELDTLMERIISQLGQGAGDFTKGILANNAAGSGSKQINKKKVSVLTPPKVLVILGLISGVFEVGSILIEHDQAVQIRLDGSLKRPSKLDKCLDEMGAMPFDEVLRAIVGRL